MTARGFTKARLPDYCPVISVEPLTLLPFILCGFIIKSRVRDFFDTDLSSTYRVKLSVKEAIQNGVLFLSHTQKVNTAK